jgi:hypothetical protein
MATVTFLNNPSQPISIAQITETCKQISSFQTQHIEILAKKIIARVMGQFALDVNFKMVREESEKRHPLFHIVPDTFKVDSKIFDALLPTVSERISEIVLKPHFFVVQGLELVLFTKTRRGLLDRIPDKQIRSRLRQAKEIVEFKESISMNLAVSLDLHFKIVTKIDDRSDLQTLGDMEGTLDQFKAELDRGDI